MLKGEAISLQDMLQCREGRAAYQQQFLAKYSQPVISFSLNIPGAVKTNAKIRQAFQVGKQAILQLLDTLNVSITDAIEIHENTGDAWIICLDAVAELLKENTMMIEENHPLGRLFDIDVLDENGRKLSRESYRTCFVCECQAQQCARARNHTAEEISQGVERILNQCSMSNKIGTIAIEAVLFEVSTTPKPGLVDRENNGAHFDMDIFTFMSSTAGLHRSFDEMFELGLNNQHLPIQELLPALRQIGMEAEHRMFEMTKGVNTHKGIIFTLGILCACVGWSLGKAVLTGDYLCQLAGDMCAGICASEYCGLEEKTSLTKGERMYQEHGLTGVRGEVESGYRTVREISLPIYRVLRAAEVEVNDALVQTLLYLIANTDDTNIVSRHNMETASYAKQEARVVLNKGGIFAKDAKRDIRKMDEDFIKRHISPGGCADLLAVTHFLHTVEEADWLGASFS